MSRIFTRKLALASGFLVPVLGLAGIFLSTFLAHSWYRWEANLLSDLGVPDRIGGILGAEGVNLAAPVFNATLISEGCLVAFFGYWLLKTKEKARTDLDLAARYYLLAGGIGMIGAGVFDESVMPLHLAFAVPFFTGMICIPFMHWKALSSHQEERPFAQIALSLGVLALIGVFGSPLASYALFGSRFIIMSGIHEVVIVAPGILWIVTLSFLALDGRTDYW